MTHRATADDVDMPLAMGNSGSPSSTLPPLKRTPALPTYVEESTPVLTSRMPLAHQPSNSPREAKAEGEDGELGPAPLSGTLPPLQAHHKTSPLLPQGVDDSPRGSDNQSNGQRRGTAESVGTSPVVEMRGDRPILRQSPRRLSSPVSTGSSGSSGATKRSAAQGSSRGASLVGVDVEEGVQQVADGGGATSRLDDPTRRRKHGKRTRRHHGRESGSDPAVHSQGPTATVPVHVAAPSETGDAATAGMPSQESTHTQLSGGVVAATPAQTPTNDVNRNDEDRAISAAADLWRQVDAENDDRVCVPYQIDQETFDVPMTCPDDHLSGNDRYWCPGKPLRISFVTWNMAQKDPRMDEVALYCVHPNAHVVVVGTQENGPYVGTNKKQRRWVSEVARLCLKGAYTLVGEEHMWAVHLAVFARSRDVAQYVSHVDRAHIATGVLGGLGGNKGGVAIGLAVSMVPQPMKARVADEATQGACDGNHGNGDAPAPIYTSFEEWMRAPLPPAAAAGPETGRPQSTWPPSAVSPARNGSEEGGDDHEREAEAEEASTPPATARRTSVARADADSDGFSATAEVRIPEQQQSCDQRVDAEANKEEEVAQPNPKRRRRTSQRGEGRQAGGAMPHPSQQQQQEEGKQRGTTENAPAPPPPTFMTLLCVTAHLAAHQSAIHRRNEDYRNIVRRLKAGYCGRHRKLFKRLLKEKPHTCRDEAAMQLPNPLQAKAGGERYGRDLDHVPAEDDHQETRVAASGVAAADSSTTDGEGSREWEEDYEDEEEEDAAEDVSQASAEVDIATLQLPQLGRNGRDLRMGNRRHHRDVTEEYDLTLFGGDLNYRIDGTRRAIEYIVQHHRDIRSILVNNDQLTLERAKGTAFNGFQEGALFFRPTYKYEVAAGGGVTLDEYNFTRKRSRLPAYCDRILYKKRRESTVARVAIRLYTDVSNVRTSDHRPVVGIVDVETVAACASNS